MRMLHEQWIDIVRECSNVGAFLIQAIWPPRFQYLLDSFIWLQNLMDNI